MVPEEAALTPESFTTFGDLLRYLRQRAALRQRDIAAVAHLSPSYVSRLEQNLDAPDTALVQHRLVPALGLQYHPEWAARLLALANEPAALESGSPAGIYGERLAATNQVAAGLAEEPHEPQLLVTKFYIPQRHNKSIARERLLARLDEALAVPLAVIAAPPGSGKTTLLADWVERRRLEPRDWRLEASSLASSPQPLVSRMAWLSLDGDDNDPATFLRYLVGALRLVAPGIGSATLALAQPPLPATKILLAPLVNQLAVLSGETVLVLDDWHLIASRGVNQLLGWLLEHMPPRLHLVIASRTDPALPLAQLRARGQLCELRGADLRFIGAEAHDLLDLAAGSEVSSADSATLEQRTEGWAAGLQLAGLALRVRHDRPEFIAAFAGSHRYLADYLTGEVLDRLPAYLRSFVMQTAILDRMCAALCDFVVEVDTQAFIADSRARAQHATQSSELDAQRLLEEMERMQLFVVALDDERRWYRYHHLFAEVVRAQLLRASGAATVARLHQRASEWYERANLVDDALSYALAAGAADQAVAIVEGRAAALIENGVLLPLLRWLARLPQEMIHAHPSLALTSAIVAIATGELERAEALLSRVEVAATSADAAGLPAGDRISWLSHTSTTLGLARASLARARSDAWRAGALARQALAIAPADQPFLRAWALWELGSAEMLAGDLQAAQRSFGALLDSAPWRYGGLFTQAAVNQARIATLQGRLSAAAQLYERAIGAARDEPAGASRAVGMLHVGLAMLYREQNELEAAERELTSALAVGGDPPSALLTALIQTALARVNQARGDKAAASAALEQAHLMLPALQAPFFLDLVLGYGYAQACLAQGDSAAVSVLLGSATLSAETRGLLRAQLLLQQNQPGAALELIEPVLSSAEAEERAGHAIELLVLQALARAALGDCDGALVAIERALRMAEPEGFVRLFVDQGAPMFELLREAQARGVALEYTAKLLAAFGSYEFKVLSAELPEASTQNSLVEPLTSRELEVLHLIAAGHSNREIARALVIELGTVKRHVHSLLGKLSAQSRTQAIVQARAHGLLSDTH